MTVILERGTMVNENYYERGKPMISGLNVILESTDLIIEITKIM